MEILGSTFDDSVFSEKKDRVPVSLTTYNAKVCEPKVRANDASVNNTASFNVNVNVNT